MVKRISTASVGLRVALRQRIVTHAYRQHVRAARAAWQRVNWTTVTLAVLFVATVLAISATGPH